MRGALGRVWLVALSFGVGTAWGDGTPRLPFLILGGVGTVLLSFRRRPMVRLPALVVLAISLGGLAAAMRSSGEVAIARMASTVPQCDVEGRVLEHAGGLGTLVAVDLASCTGFRIVERAGAAWLDGAVGYSGSMVSGRVWLLPLSNEPFDEARRRAGGMAALDAIDVEVSRPPSGPAGIAAAVRDGLTRSTEPLRGETGALLRGLTIGDTGDLAPGTVEHFRRSGLSHLVAVSGSNVAIVLGAVVLLAAPLPHRLRLALCGLALVLFVLIVGPEPSVLRAAAMGGIGLSALAWGRLAEPLHALGLAVLVVLAFRPSLVFSVGLQLSVAATAGIVLWTATLARCFGFLPRVVALGFAATMAAQAAVAPVLIGAFGQLPLSGPVANLLAMPAVAPATVLGLAAAVIGTFSETWGVAVARLAEPFSGWILLVGNKIGDLGWSSVPLPSATAWMMAVPVLVAAAAALVGRTPSASACGPVRRPPER